MFSAAALAQEIRDARFTPRRFRPGYDMGVVDNYLDLLVGTLTQGAPLGPLLERADFDEVSFREAYDRAEVDDLVARVAEGAAAFDPTAADQAPRLRAVAEQRSADSEPTPANGVIAEQRRWWQRVFGRRA